MNFYPPTMKKIVVFLLPLFFITHVSASQMGYINDQKSADTSDHYTISNPLVLVTGASRYIKTQEEEKENKDPSLPLVKKQMGIFYAFAKECGYEVRSTFFDERGNIFPNHGKKSKEKMDGEFLYKDKFELWLEYQYHYLRQNSEKYDAFFFFFSGHEICDKHNQDFIITSDRVVYPWENIEKLFLFPIHQNLRVWVAKCPKFFFKLTCRREDQSNLVKLKLKGKNVNLAAKTYTFYATSKGNPSSDQSGLYLARTISNVFSKAMQCNNSLSWVDSRLKKSMQKFRYNMSTEQYKLDNIVDEPFCYNSLVSDEIFFSPRRKPLDFEITREKWWTAIKKDDVKGVKDILANYIVDVNTKSNKGWTKGSTPLHVCAERNNEEVAEVLLKYKADVNAKNRYIYTPLHFAGLWNSKEVAELLLKYKADINAKNYGASTPLHVCAEFNSKEVAKVLLKNGADKGIKDKGNKIPIDIAKEKGHQEMIDLLK